MKKNIKLIIIGIVLVALVGGAYILYDNLSDELPDIGIIGSEDGPTEIITSDSKDQTESETQSNQNTAPDFTVLDESGKEVKLSGFRGKKVVLNFWTTWCTYCKQEMPDFNEAYKEYEDVQFLMVNATDNVSETVALAKNFKESTGYEFPIFFDTKQEAVTAYGVTSYPQSFFINEEGVLVARQPGMLTKEILQKGISMLG